jgi:hypothetical protein
VLSKCLKERARFALFPFEFGYIPPVQTQPAFAS